MVAPLIVEAAQLLVTAYVDRQQNADRMSQIARMIAANNAVLIAEMSRIVKQAFSDFKLDDCNNKLATLATFYGEYATNLEDFAKLQLIEQQCQFVLDNLNDPDIKFSGITSYVTVASLRINALALKSHFQSADKENAKNLATDSIHYVEGIKPQLIDAVKARVSPTYLVPQYSSSAGGHGVSRTCFCYCYYTIDGSTENFQTDFARGLDAAESPQKCSDYFNSQDQSLYINVESKRNQRIDELIKSLPLEEIDKSIEAWKDFLTK